MQFTYEEAVKKLYDFLGKHATAENYCEMEQVLFTVLRGDDKYHQAVYEEGQDDGYAKGYKDGIAEEKQSTEDAFQDGYGTGARQAIERYYG